MIYRLQHRRYRLPFRVPVRTGHGLWTEREGLVVRMEDETGRCGWGEAAPIPWFDTETVEEAAALLGKLGETVSSEALARVDEQHGCLKFALATAAEREPEAGELPVAARLPVAALLPAGRAALAALDRAVEGGYVAAKWKVGTGDAADEMALLDDLLARRPDYLKLRLDANGAWTGRQAAKWLECCAERPVELVEQPCFAPAAEGSAARRRVEDILFGLAGDYPTPIALDESVAGLPSLRNWLERGWPGAVVVKPALTGAPADVLALLTRHQADAVFSSAFETAVGRRAALRLAFHFQGRQARALGFGIAPLFHEGRFDGLPAVPFVTADDVERMQPEAIWNALS